VARALGVEHDALLVVLGEQRIIGADLLDEAAVARRARIGDDDTVIGTLLGATARQADRYGHVLLPSLFQKTDVCVTQRKLGSPSATSPLAAKDPSLRWDDALSRAHFF
jgi:hypothetical protein